MDAVAGKGLVHHVFTEYMSFPLSINDMYSWFFNKGGGFSAQSADPHEESYSPLSQRASFNKNY